MTTEKLYDTLQLMVNLDYDLKLQTSLSQIKDSLTNLVNSPAAVQYQAGLAAAMETFTSGYASLGERLTPTQQEAIAELGGREFFEVASAEKVKDAVERNAMTPSVARDFVDDFTRRRTTYLTTVGSTLDGLTELLKSDETKLEPAPASAAFTIPWNLFDDQLDQFAKELSFIDKLMGHLGEASTGEMQPVHLRTLSTSIPVVEITAGLKALGILATTLGGFLGVWEKVQKMRTAREDLKEMGVSKRAIEELTEDITTTVEEFVEQSTTIALESYPKGEVGRKNELQNGLRRDFRRLFGQIERGLTVEIRTRDVNENDNKGEPASEDEKAISEISRKMRFPAPSTEPLLLSSGEIIEGEISERTVTKKTTTTTTKRTTKAKQTSGD